MQDMDEKNNDDDDFAVQKDYFDIEQEYDGDDEGPLRAQLDNLIDGPNPNLVPDADGFQQLVDGDAEPPDQAVFFDDKGKPWSATRRMRWERAQRAAAKKSCRLSLEACDWELVERKKDLKRKETGRLFGRTRCCDRGCSERYPAVLVQVLRRYGCAQSKGNLRRMFDNRSTHRQGAQRSGQFVLETPEHLASSFGVIGCKPTQDSTQDVCGEFLFWSVCDRSKNFFYQPTVKKGSKRKAAEGSIEVIGADGLVENLFSLRDKPARSTDKRDGVGLWLDNQVKYWLQDPTSNQVILPYRTLQQAHDQYQHEEKESGEDASKIAAYDCFVREFRRRNDRRKKGGEQAEGMESVRTRLRKWLPFSKCDECFTFRRDIDREKDEKAKAALKKQYRAHIAMVIRERRSYYRRRKQGRLERDKYVSMIIDGADQAKFAMPYSKEKTHCTDAAYKCKTHLMGVLVHGRGQYAYTVTDNVKMGNNATVDVLYRTLVDIKKKEGKLPRKLYLQLDNTSRQCKGFGVMGYLGMLVDHGVFEKVVLSFLPVGHTHEDIDQFFSRVAVYMRKESAYDLEEFGECIRKSFHRNGTETIVEHLSNLCNFSQWVEHKLNPNLTKGIMSYQQYRLFHRYATFRLFYPREFL